VDDYHFGLPHRIYPKKEKKAIAKFQVPGLYLLAMYSQKVKLKIKSAKKPSDFFKKIFNIHNSTKI
jgi:hypothetical protein